ncbi:MAG: MiaB/RimO family radical SAM methylthiotransferase [Planctomycetota bacterium]|nr:MAG: MiaB/RimO family radical SAM methylthiotransferase [Planctomycetota bacterium]
MTGRTVYLETFGCQMNELDSELVAGELARLGYAFTGTADDADVVLYNTCSVREQAEQKVWSRLGELTHRKGRDPSVVVGVLGCMAERDGVDLIKRMPVVDLMCGPGELDKLPALLDNAVRTKESLASDSPSEGGPRASTGSGTGAHGKTVTGRNISAQQVALQGNTSRRSATLAAAEDSLEMLDLSRSVSPVDPASGAAKRSAYVRITRGCNKFCTYCVVPFTRGAEIHRPPDHIIDECKKLADAGVIEITLLGQTVNHYRFEHGASVAVGGIVQPQKGRTYKGSHQRDAFAGEQTTTFADLLARIHDEVPAIQRLRFVTSYPRDFGDDVLEVIRDHPRICRYLHVPAQSGSNRILKKMNRGYTVEEYNDFIDRARHYLDQPELGRPLMLSGDIIVGFPTETDEDYDATVALLRRSRYKNCFIFKYSPRPGTVAYDKIPDDVPDEAKRRRNNDSLAIQSEISDQIAREQVGREVEVFVEGPSKQQLKREGLSHGDIRKAGGAITLTIGGQDPSTSGTGFQPVSTRGTGFQPVDSAATSTLPNETVQLSGRTDTDLIVFFDAPASERDALTGQMLRLRITEADRLSLHGKVI